MVLRSTPQAALYITLSSQKTSQIRSIMTAVDQMPDSSTIRSSTINSNKSCLARFSTAHRTHNRHSIHNSSSIQQHRNKWKVTRRRMQLQATRRRPSARCPTQQRKRLLASRPAMNKKRRFRIQYYSRNRRFSILCWTPPWRTHSLTLVQLKKPVLNRLIMWKTYSSRLMTIQALLIR